MTHTTLWSVGDTYIDAQFPTGVAEISDGTGYVVALVPLHQGSSRNADRSQMPNLIAAAPELLAVCNAIAGHFELWLEDLDESQERILTDARAAIAKATGGAQ